MSENGWAEELERNYSDVFLTTTLFYLFYIFNGLLLVQVSLLAVLAPVLLLFLHATMLAETRLRAYVHIVW